MHVRWTWGLVASFGLFACSKTVVLKEAKPLQISAKAPEKEEPAPEPEPPKRIEVKEDRVEVNETILFAYSSSWLVEQSHDILDELAKVLNAHPEIKKIRVEGHTDSDGGAPENLRLSKKRAAAVVKYLIKQGVAENRLVSEGYGQTKPIAGNDTEEGKAKNRRVVFTILERAKDAAAPKDDDKKVKKDEPKPEDKKMKKTAKDDDDEDVKPAKDDKKAKDVKKDPKKDAKKDPKKDKGDDDDSE